MTISTTPSLAITQTGGAQHVAMWIPVYGISKTLPLQVQITGAVQTVTMQVSG